MLADSSFLWSILSEWMTSSAPVSGSVLLAAGVAGTVLQVAGAAVEVAAGGSH